jgi:hypothetical protein
MQKTEIPQFCNLYQKISDLMRMTGELAVHQGFMVNDSLNSHFKYQREQGRTSFQEAYLLVQATEFRYKKAQKILDDEKLRLFKKQNYELWEIQDPSIIKEVYKVRNNFEEAKSFMLPEKTNLVQELLDEAQYFKQQLFNEVRRVIMLDYFSSRENFLDVGEQYNSHLVQNEKEWTKFTQFYNDLNNARKTKDDEYKREQFIGEELDWKMLADNLSLFQSQMGDLQEMQGFDPNSSLAMDQSMVAPHRNSDAGLMSARDPEPFKSDEIIIPKQRKQTSAKKLEEESSSRFTKNTGETGSDHNSDQEHNKSSPLKHLDSEN